MSQKRHSANQIIVKLRRADVLLGKDTKVPEICKQLGIAEQTYYRWRQKYGGRQPKNLSRGLVFVWPELTTYLLNHFTLHPAEAESKFENEEMGRELTRLRVTGGMQRGG